MDMKNKATRILIITIDNNCINAKQEIKDLNKLEKYDEEGIVRIVKTDAFDTEANKYKGTWGEKSKAKAAQIPEVIGVAVIDHSRLDHMKLASGEDKQLDEIAWLLFNKPLCKLASNCNNCRLVKDVMHLSPHLLHKNDIFVTRDKKHIWTKRAELEDKFGIVVANPVECIRYIEHFIKTGCYK